MPGQKVSPIEHLVRIGATNGNFLRIAEETADQDPPVVVCFAQLPYSLITKITKLTRPGSSRIFDLTLFPCSIAIDDSGRQILLGPEDPDEHNDNILCTQIIGSVRYWGKRGEWFPQYAKYVTPFGLREGHIVPSERSWLNLHQPVSAVMYEYDVAKRLLGDFFVAIKRSLPFELATAYSILLNYFTMPYPGRISFGGKPYPTLRKVQTIQPQISDNRKVEMAKKKQSVFLSYGGPDTAIAEALRNDLEASGIDTWWFPSNAQWGEKIHHEVSRNIKKYDRLLLLCSCRSLIRTGVLHEIEEVIERESEEGGSAILIPVALDSVLHTDWWRYEPDENGEPIDGSFEDRELERRRSLAGKLIRRVVGDLKESKPGDQKWRSALERLKMAL